MGSPLRIPTVGLLPSPTGGVARNACIVLEVQFVGADAVAAEVDGRATEVDVETGRWFGPGTTFGGYLLVRPRAGLWPARSKVRVRIGNDGEEIFAAEAHISDGQACRAPRAPRFAAPLLETGPVYMGEVHERRLVRIAHDALDASAGAIVQLRLRLLDRATGDVLEESGFVATGIAGSVLVMSDSLRSIAGGELVDLVGNRTAIPAAGD
jgi:hypothetical protein